MMGATPRSRGRSPVAPVAQERAPVARERAASEPPPPTTERRAAASPPPAVTQTESGGGAVDLGRVVSTVQEAPLAASPPPAVTQTESGGGAVDLGRVVSTVQKKSPEVLSKVDLSSPERDQTSFNTKASKTPKDVKKYFEETVYERTTGASFLNHRRSYYGTMNGNELKIYQKKSSEYIDVTQNYIQDYAYKCKDTVKEELDWIIADRLGSEVSFFDEKTRDAAEVRIKENFTSIQTFQEKLGSFNGDNNSFLEFIKSKGNLLLDQKLAQQAWEKLINIQIVENICDSQFKSYVDKSHDSFLSALYNAKEGNSLQLNTQRNLGVTDTPESKITETLKFFSDVNRQQDEVKMGRSYWLHSKSATGYLFSPLKLLANLLIMAFSTSVTQLQTRVSYNKEQYVENLTKLIQETDKVADSNKRKELKGIIKTLVRLYAQEPDSATSDQHTKLYNAVKLMDPRNEHQLINNHTFGRFQHLGDNAKLSIAQTTSKAFYRTAENSKMDVADIQLASLRAFSFSNQAGNPGSQ